MPSALASARTDARIRGNVRAILAQKGFRRLLTVRLTSQLGDGWFQAGLAGAVFFNPQDAAGPTKMALAFGLLLVPYSVLGPFVGVFLDRWSRRSVLFVANTIRAALVLPAAWQLSQGHEDFALVLLALGVIATNRFFLAGLSAAQPHVVDAPRLVTANALATTLGTVIFSIGLGTSALIFHKAGADLREYAAVAAVACLAYLFSAILARLSFTVDALGPDETDRHGGSILTAIADIARGMVAGVQHLGARRGAAALVLVQTGHRCLYGILTLTTLLLYRSYFTTDDSESSLMGLGTAVLAGATGALAASFVTPPITRRIGGWRWVAGLIGALSVLVPAFGLPFVAPLLLVAVFVTNIASQGTKIVCDTAIQVECQDEYRGRVFSVNDTTYNIAFVVGLFIAAVTVPVDGHSPSIVIAVGASYAVLAIWYAVVAGRHARLAGDDIQISRPD